MSIDPYGRDPIDRTPNYAPEPAPVTRYLTIGAVAVAVVVIGLVLFTGGREPAPSTANAPATEAPASPITPRAPGNAVPPTTRQ